MVASGSNARGQKRQFETWVNQQRIGAEDHLSKVRLDRHSARMRFLDLFLAINDPERKSQIAALRGRLRAAPEENMKSFLLSCEDESEVANERDTHIRKVAKLSFESMSSIRSLTPLARNFGVMSLTEGHSPGPGSRSISSPSSKLPPQSKTWKDVSQW